MPPLRIKDQPHPPGNAVFCAVAFLSLVLLFAGSASAQEIEASTLGDRVINGESLNSKEQEFLRRYRQKNGLSQNEAAKKIKEYWAKSESLDLEAKRLKPPLRKEGSAEDGGEPKDFHGVIIIAGIGVGVLVVVLCGVFFRNRYRRWRIERSTMESLSSSDLLLGKSASKKNR